MEKQLSNALTLEQQDTHLSKFYHWESTQPQQVFLKQPQGDSWTDYTWGEVGEQARRIAAFLKASFPPKSNIGIVSKNCAHWIINDLAIMMAGHVSVPFYPTLTADKLHEVLVHSECKALFVGKLDEWELMSQGVPAGLPCISYPQYPDQAELKGMKAWEDILAENAPLSENHSPDMEDLMTIIYTSGTTGMPKGVIYTYERMATAMNRLSDIFHLFNNQNRHFSYLPLCHIAERNIVESASIYGGASIYFSESLDTFAQNLQAAQPTHFLAVPRIWTKFQLGILAKMPAPQLEALLDNPQMAPAVQKQIKTSLGLAEAKVVLTGAAPMPASLIAWYKKLDIHIQEVYGMTENVGACTYMPLEQVKMGTVGKPYPGVEIKIEEGSQEVLMKAPWVMNGYYKSPEKTAEALAEGWLHTGDSGEVDAEGYLKITGRVKDTFKTAKGEFVVPAPIEYQFATNSHVEQVCILGRGLAQPIALVVLSEMGRQLPREALQNSLDATLQKLNASVMKHEQVQSVVVMREAWGVENGLLTPTLKIKRNVLEEKYEIALQNWAAQPETVIWE
ncbi:MAG: AMP-binding protein [Microscillaceae bacterium]|nr:AMP-binding protein [Microscillaceae bacterium]